MPPTTRRGVGQAVFGQPPQPGTVVRLARLAAGWSQGDLGRLCGYSASQVSRWENGRLPLRDVGTLRKLAQVLCVQPEVFGLAPDHATGAPDGFLEHAGPRVGHVPAPTREEDDDPVRRRAFLVAAGLAGVSLASPVSGAAHATGAVDPASLLADRLGDALLSQAAAGTDPLPVSALRDGLTVAQNEFSACQYVLLARRLPALLTAAQDTAADHPEARVHRLLAQAYNLATRALIKLEASGLEWVSADRGLHAARAASDALTLAESQRLVASVARRAGHHDRAQTLTLAAASHLTVNGSHPAPEHLVMYGVLNCSAGYAAARAGNRDRANELLAEAETTARRLTDPVQHRALSANVISHRVSAAYVLGDAGAALAHARSLPLGAMPTTERRARLLVDAAMSYAQLDKPDQAYRTLLAAERTAPGEVRTRNAVRRLVADLMASPRQAGMPGLRTLAHRVHAVI